MRKSIIVAIDQYNGIGYQNQMPWHLPAELKRFKKLTMGHHIIMGRKTYESIAKPLPGRITIVVTRNRAYQAPDCLIAHSLSDAFELAKENGEGEVFVCGGSWLYREALPIADRIYLTRIHMAFQTDISFPDFDKSQWVQISTSFHPADEKNPYSFTTFTYQRRFQDVQGA